MIVFDREQTYQQVVANAEHYLALGVKRVHLDRNMALDAYPWASITEFKIDGYDHLPSGIHAEADVATAHGPLTIGWRVELLQRVLNQPIFECVVDASVIRDLIARVPKQYHGAIAEELRRIDAKVSKDYADVRKTLDALDGLLQQVGYALDALKAAELAPES